MLSVSQDEQPAAWQRAVQQDTLPCTQVLDAQMCGLTGHLYQLMDIPATWLLDPEGRIIARDLRGADLRKALTRHLT